MELLQKLSDEGRSAQHFRRLNNTIVDIRSCRKSWATMILIWVREARKPIDGSRWIQGRLPCEDQRDAKRSSKQPLSVEFEPNISTQNLIKKVNCPHRKFWMKYGVQTATLSSSPQSSKSFFIGVGTINTLLPSVKFYRGKRSYIRQTFTVEDWSLLALRFGHKHFGKDYWSTKTRQGRWKKS